MLKTQILNYRILCYQMTMNADERLKLLYKIALQFMNLEVTFCISKEN